MHNKFINSLVVIGLIASLAACRPARPGTVAIPETAAPALGSETSVPAPTPSQLPPLMKLPLSLTATAPVRSQYGTAEPWSPCLKARMAQAGRNIQAGLRQTILAIGMG